MSSTPASDLFLKKLPGGEPAGGAFCFEGRVGVFLTSRLGVSLRPLDVIGREAAFYVCTPDLVGRWGILFPECERCDICSMLIPEPPLLPIDPLCPIDMSHCWLYGFELCFEANFFRSCNLPASNYLIILYTCSSRFIIGCER